MRGCLTALAHFCGYPPQVFVSQPPGLPAMTISIARFAVPLLPLLTIFSVVWCVVVAPCASQEAVYQGAAEPTTAAAIYGQGVRETEWLSPAEAQRKFHLPPGFSIDLFASEPQIAKPMNMAWDARGRLWVTSSREYPYPAADGAQGRDTIQILEDTDGDGRADKSTTFADGLNIPMGLLPVRNGVICFSIPNLWLLRDVDGDDRVDERVLLLGPFDTSRDTHGMINSLRRGQDGWIYACHGFNNQSLVTAADGSRVQLNSGNTFRFREDGSSIQQITSGQVNPFGVTRDEWGNWYSADCHSKPLTRLLRGACYPSFGRPHDGLGFAPSMMHHLHGSTAICGLLYYQAQQFPAAYRHLFYSGNVMTSRINCNALEWQGATAQARELPDFLTSDDPWFRPVDIQLGSDGAMYVSDFYNRIIGHYEVPLEHPGRDRTSGRIWRISYQGDQPAEPATSLRVEPAQLKQELASTNVARRELAVGLALPATEEFSSARARSVLLDAEQEEALRISCLEILLQRGELEVAAELLSETAPPHLLVRLLDLATELPLAQRVSSAAQVRRQLPYENPQANLAACQLLGSVQSADDIERLASMISQPGDASYDAALSHTARIAIRDILMDDAQLAAATASWPVFSTAASRGEKLALRTPASADAAARDKLIAECLLAVPSLKAAARLLDYVAAHPSSDPRWIDTALAAVTKQADADLLQSLLVVLKRVKPDSLLEQAQQFERVCQIYLAQHDALSPPLREFGVELQTEIEQVIRAQPQRLTWRDAAGNDWGIQARQTAGGKSAALRSSFTLGESYTGELASEPFACPAELQFLIAGHNALPGQKDPQQNYIELQNAATGQSIMQAFPPRSDTAQRIQWSLADWQEQMVRLVVVDGDAGSAYAWLAVGQFSLESLNANDDAAWLAAYGSVVKRGLRRLDAAAIESLHLSSRPQAEIVLSALAGAGQRAAATLAEQALKIGREDLISPQLLSVKLAHSNEAAATAAQTEPPLDLVQWTKPLAASLTLSQQGELARELMRSVEGCRLLQQLLQQAVLSPQCMRQPDVLLPASIDEQTERFLREQMQQAQQLPISQQTATARIGQLNWDTADVELGKKLMQQHCASCHQLRGQGALVGPQLDGTIVRGAQRLGEDILEPNANVDAAFRTTALLLDDDTVLTGMVRENEDGSLSVTGQDGQAVHIPAARVADRRDSLQSLMPSNFAELLDDHQLASLLKYLIGN